MLSGREYHRQLSLFNPYSVLFQYLQLFFQMTYSHNLRRRWLLQIQSYFRDIIDYAQFCIMIRYIRLWALCFICICMSGTFVQTVFSTSGIFQSCMQTVISGGTSGAVCSLKFLACVNACMRDIHLKIHRIHDTTPATGTLSAHTSGVCMVGHSSKHFDKTLTFGEISD